MSSEPLSLPLVSDTAYATTDHDREEAVRKRYSAASQMTEASLCCPVQYDPKLLDVLPAELIERDYGCGDPSRWVEPGDTVLDLGSGGGKVCYIAAQVVGPTGQVWGVDMNDDMLALAERYRDEIALRLGYDNVRFFKGRIQDLGLDLRRFESRLRQHPIRTAADWLASQQLAQQMRETDPMIPDESVDVIVSNCVLNLVGHESREQLFREMHRVLRRGGRAVISDIVSDEPIPEKLRQDPTLWSGCISGAYLEEELLAHFADAGFYGVELVDRPAEPWATLEGIELRGVTVRAYKGKEGPCLERNQAVIYRGPWRQVTDDDGHTFQRGVPTAVCDKTFQILSRTPYQQQMIPIAPATDMPREQAKPFDCRGTRRRDPRELKGNDFRLTQLPDGGCCGSQEC